ncbi:MAG: hypothetical protein B9S34_09360 [Opitutia bacterium Tous-C1TDCM]|nr:MAG: hypothetical protein B9S34_09360 [Opitutae bacterium Tous-C1TDCM]
MIPPASALAAAADAESPWLGLASFTEETRSYFHGREAEVGELGRRVQRKLLTILFGQSGLGKTSILRAGLVPLLRPEGYCPVYVRLDYGQESPPPSEQIKQAVLRASEAAGHWTKPGAAAAGESLWEFLHHRDDVLKDAAGRTLVPLLIFDQFEEIFTLAQGDDHGRRRAAQFIEDLADLVENRAPRALEARLEADEAGLERFDFARADCRILIALREDYLAHLEGLKAQMPSITQNRMRLARMAGPQALAAVTGPGGALVNEEVAAAIVRFVAGGAEIERAEVEPSLLSLVCHELNAVRRAQGRTEISADLLAGSRDSILAEFYERVLQDQPATVRAFIEDELLTESGYRESIAEERIRKGLSAAGADGGALARLVDRRLLRIEERLDVRRVEFTHDVLCGVVKISRDLRQEREAKAAEARRRAETESQLAQARRDAWRARLVAGGCVVLAVGAIGAAAWGYVNLRRAEAAEDRVAAERDRVQVSRGEAEKLVTFLLDDLYRQLEPTGRIEIVSGLARRALAYFDALPAELRDARSDRYRAVALSRLGLALSLQGKTLEAEEPLREAHDLFRRLAARPDAGEEVIVDLAAVLRQQSRNAYMQNRPQLAIDTGRLGLEVILVPAARPGPSAAVMFEYGRTQMNLSFVLMRDRQNDPALQANLQAEAVFNRLLADPVHRLRAGIYFGEAKTWKIELLRLMGRGNEALAENEAALKIADEIVAKEAGNLGALRSRALLRSRKAQAALDGYDYRTAEALGRLVVEDWSEYLRFDADSDTARNNRRVARNFQAEALWRQGEIDAAIVQARENTREALAVGGSPSTVRGSAFQTARTDSIEAELGRVNDIDAALAAGKRLRELAAAQVDAESYCRAMTPVWNDAVRADLQLRVGSTEAALATARDAARRLRPLQPKSGVEKFNQRMIGYSIFRVQVEACFKLGRWAEAADAARELIAGRPAPDDTSDSALDWLAEDRADAAVAFARHGDIAAARETLALADAFNRQRRAAGAKDYPTRQQTAKIALGSGLLAADPAEKRAQFRAGLAEIAAMPPQPQQLRTVRELKAVLESELARVP